MRQVFPSSHVSAPLMNAIVVVTMGEFRTLNFNNTMRVLCSYNGSVVNMLELE